MKERLDTILRTANTLRPDINEDRYKVKTIKFKSDGKDVEVRYFLDSSYRGPVTEDFIERFDFLGSVAEGEIGSNSAKLAKLKNLQEIFRARLGRELQLNIDMDQRTPTNFDDVIQKAEKFFLEYQEELANVMYGTDGSMHKKLKKLKEASRQKVIANGRPIIVNVFPDNSFSAQIPKGNRTLPGDYRTERTPGMNPNSVADVIGSCRADGVELHSVGFRAASYSVFKMNKEEKARRKLNAQNVRQDLIDGDALLHPPGVPVAAGIRKQEHLFISLLSPTTPIAEQGAKVFMPNYESEVRQLEDTNQAVMANHNQVIPCANGAIQPVVNHMNFSVKDPESFEGKVLDESKFAGINEKGFKNYIEAQAKDLLVAEPTPQNIDDLLNQANAAYQQGLRAGWARNDLDKALQKKYFYKVCQLYFSENEAYKITHDNTFQFVAQLIRSEQLRGVIVHWNCKTTKDRSGWLSDYLKTFIDEEQAALNNPAAPFDFQAKLQQNHEFGASLEATSKNSPGARGNRVNDPTKNDKRKMDSRMSLLAKIENSKFRILKKFVRLGSGVARAGDKADKLLDHYLNLQSDENFAHLVKLLKGVKNRYLVVAMVNLLDRKNLPLPKDVDIEAVVEQINELFSDEKKFNFSDFKGKYLKFLEIVQDIPGLNDLHSEFIASIVLKEKLPDIKDLKKLPERQLRQCIEQLESAIVFAKVFAPFKAKQLSRYKKQLEKEIKPGLYFGDLEKEEPTKHVYIYQSGKFKELSEIEQEETILEKQHTLIESETQLRYLPPVDDSGERNGKNVDDEIIWQVIQKAMRKFGVTDPTTLQFEGALKEKAKAVIENHTQFKFDKPTMKTGRADLEMKIPEHTPRSPMVSA